MTNKEISGLFKLTASLLELHDENQFKIRSYTNAVFNVEKQEALLINNSKEELESIEGIGKGLAQSILEIQETGTFKELEQQKASTPEGILEMINLKGLGPKKIKTVWRELGIESMEELYEACQQNKLSKLKGFGIKTQETILKNMEFLMSQRGKMLFANAELYAESIVKKLKNGYPENKFDITGGMRRFMDVVSAVEIITDFSEVEPVAAFLSNDEQLEVHKTLSGPYSIRGKFTDVDLMWHIRFTRTSRFCSDLMLSTGSGKHLAAIHKDNISLHKYLLENEIESEEATYNIFKIPYLIPELREGSFELLYDLDNPPSDFLTLQDLKGPFHNHSNYSDGKNTIRQLAQYCIGQGYEYLGLSDHSKSAFYANGLQEFQIRKQHEEIDALNKEFTPFKIFKGIESDILNDGSLDYEKDILTSFDFIVASIHSNLNMDIQKATQRLIKAIENPYTTFLGHPTGRLLLRRQGYPVNHKKIIDACAENKVIIEINANPWRLDLDWRWINYALEKEVTLSINPDAHEIEGFNDMKYGVYMGRKGGLTKEKTFNAWSLVEVEKYLEGRKSSI